MPKLPVFDEAHWQAELKKPDWYLRFVPYAAKAQDSLANDPERLAEFHKTIRHFFERALEHDKIALASSGPDLDKQRQPVDTIVIHHTSHTPGYRLSYMNAVQLLNIYAPYYANPTIRKERDLKGTAVWSGHKRAGKPSFLAYHWLMRMDGSFEHLLEDNQIGWHAGNWDINCRSIGICLDNDYEKHDPTDEILQKLAAHIKQNYPGINPAKIIGHCEARTGTICPGTNFITGWKPKLLEYLSKDE